jgi:hypothetical protein
MTAREAEQLGVDVAPVDVMVEWTNDKTGDTQMMPKGVHPGFGQNPLKARVKVLSMLADEPAGTEWTE